MSRVGKLPVQIPDGVKVDVKDNTVTVEGPKGKLSQGFNKDVEIKVKDSQLIVDRTNDSKNARSYHGLYRQLCWNMVEGVSKGFTKSLLINGVGYRAEVKGDILHLNLGFSNPVEFVIPEGITVTCEGTTKVVITGIQKQLVGQISSEIRSLRPPEPYKGKGVRYEDERISRKIGKSGVK